MGSEFIKAVSLIFAAEMGDKTQILAMAFATRYPIKKVLIGILIGSFLNHGLAVLLGTLISNKLPIELIQTFAGFAFVFFALWTLRIDNEDEEKQIFNFGPIATVALAFFIGELGDKTQLAAVTLGADTLSPLLTLTGTVTGMVVTGGLGILIGKKLGDKIPELYIKIISAMIFFIFGFNKLYSSISDKYLQINYVLSFSLIVGVIGIILIVKMYKAKKRGKESPYVKKSKELYEYYKKTKKDINKICLGISNCIGCEGNSCTVGQIKNIIDDELKGKKDEKTNIDLNNKYKEKNFDEKKLKESLKNTLNIVKKDFNNKEYKNLHLIRKNLEKMLFNKSIEKAENLEDYKKKLKKINKKAEKFEDFYL